MPEQPQADQNAALTRLRMEARRIIEEDPQQALRLVERIEKTNPNFPGVRALRSRIQQALANGSPNTPAPGQANINSVGNAVSIAANEAQARRAVHSKRGAGVQAPSTIAALGSPARKRVWATRAFVLMGVLGAAMMLAGVALAGYTGLQMAREYAGRPKAAAIVAPTRPAPTEAPAAGPGIQLPAWPLRLEPRYPLRADEPLPGNLLPITPQNVAGLQQIAYRGAAAPKISISPDGKFACIYANLAVDIFDTEKLEVVATLPANGIAMGWTSGAAGICTFSPNSRYAALPQTRSWSVYRLPEWELVDHYDIRMPFFQFSPDGSYFAAYGTDGADGTGVSLWKIGEKAPFHVFPVEGIYAVVPAPAPFAFTPDGTRLVYIDEKIPQDGKRHTSVMIAGLAGDFSTQALYDEPNPIERVHGSPDGRYVYLEGYEQVEMIDLSTGSKTISYPLRGGPFTSGAYENEQIAILTEDEQLSIYPAGSPEPITTIKVKNDFGASVLELKFVQGGNTLAAVDMNGLPQLFAPSGAPYSVGPANVRPAAEPFQAGGSNYTFAYVDDGLALWDIDRQQAVNTLEAFSPYTLASLAFAPDGLTLAAGSFESSAIAWDVDSGKMTDLFRPLAIDQIDPAHALFHVRFTSDGKYLLGKSSRQADSSNSSTCDTPIFDLATGAQTQHNLSTLCDYEPAISSDGNWLTLGREIYSYPDLALWTRLEGDTKRSADYQPMQTLYIDTGKQTAFSLDGRYFILGEKGSLSIWETGAWQTVNQEGGLKTDIFSLAVAPDSSHVTVGLGDGSIELRALPDGHLLNAIQAGDSEITQLAFSPDGRLLAAASTAGVSIWEMATNQKLQTIETITPAHYGNEPEQPAAPRIVSGFLSIDTPPVELLFSPDGRLLAVQAAAGIILYGMLP